MKIKHQEIQIPQDNPFVNCKLEREPYARVLTDIVSTYADGFVLAINNEWGTGKTTFVKMWEQQLKNEDFQTIYFNAWENDFDSNPLVALMSELNTLTGDSNKEVFKSVLEKGAVLVKNIAPTLAKSLIKKYVVDIDDIASDAIENTTKGATEIFESEIKEYSSKKKTIVEFRKSLEDFVKQTNSSKPLIFIIDELDRCRPNYAVEVLEQIKHFFSVSGIVFVLSIDKKHLGAAVKGVYGSEEIDSNEYLRRFIDLEYSIPTLSTNNFVKYLFEYYSFKDFFSSQERIKVNRFQDESENFKLTAEFLFTKSKSTLRQQERIFAHSRLVLCYFKSNEPTFSHLLFILVYLKTMQNDDFQRIERNELSLQELSDLFFEIINSEKKYPNGISISLIEALLLWFYNNDQGYHDKVNLIENDDFNNPITPIMSKLDDKNTISTLAKCFRHISIQSYETLSLSYLINKINLTQTDTLQ